MRLEPGAMLKHYRLVEPVGEGGMGVVWKAEDTVLGRTVALKVLPAELSADEKRRRMFLDEARLASSLNDARIASVHEFAREGDLDFIVMELVDGRPLTKLIQGRPLPAEKVADWGQQVGQALSRAHRKGLLHRDIKPANILITTEGEVKVVDFGVAVLFDRQVAAGGDDAGEATSVQTVTTMRESSTRDAVAGTLPYMSPEQVRGEELSVHSDIFSLGVVLYEMTTGERPFRARTNDELADAISQARPAPVHDLVPDVPLDLDRIIHKALAAKAADRYQTMEDMAVDLKRLGRDLESGTSPTYGDLKRPEAPGRKLSAGWVAGTVVAGIFLLAGAAVAVKIMSGSSGSDAAASQVGENTVLVLPLEVRGQSEGAGYVGQTFAETVAVTLAQAKDLKILPVPEESLPRGEDRTRMARSRGAGLLLTGSLTRDGDVVHASLSMVDTVENRIVWGAQREVPEGNLAGLASSLAREGVEALSPSEVTIYKSRREVGSNPALASSQLTSEALGALRRNEQEPALEATRQLVALFPGELEAHYLRAEALLDQWFRTQTGRARDQLEVAATAMERLDPVNPYHGIYRALTTNDPARMLAEAERVLARDDLSPRLRYIVLAESGWMKRNIGDIEGAVMNLEAALRVIPADAEGLANLGYLLREAGRPEEGLLRARQAVALEPHWWRAHQSLGHVLSGLGLFDEAAGAYIKACDLGEIQRPCAAAAGSLFRAGRSEEADGYVERAAAMEPSVAGTYNLACYHAQRGNKDEAFAYLDQTLELGWGSMWLASDPDLEPLHGDPRFEKVVERTRELVGLAPRGPLNAGDPLGD